ncbi:MAG: hypothetical protein AAF292_01170 [Pseudomonadota bacterium]
MHRLVERSIALWKAQNGPFREKVGRHLADAWPDLGVLPIQTEAAFFIDYTNRRCDYV